MGELLDVDNKIKQLIKEGKDSEAREYLASLDTVLLNTLYSRYCKYQPLDTKTVMAGRIVRTMSAERY